MTVTVKNATRRFGSTVAVDNVSIEFLPGRVAAVFGPNGAGKSTLFEGIVSGRFDKGTVKRSGQVGFAKQRAVVWDRLTVEEQLTMAARISKVSPKRVSESIEEYGLGTEKHVLAKHLSGGMRRRLSTALALIAQPPIRLLDEPEAGLDLPTRTALYGAMRSWAAGGATVVFATHHLTSAIDAVDDVALMSAGKCLAFGEPRKLIAEHAPAARWVFELEEEIDAFDDDARITRFGRRLVAAGESAKSTIQDYMASKRIAAKVSERAPNLEDVFLELAL